VYKTDASELASIYQMRIQGEMKVNPKLIVMLTYNDMTVKNAAEVFEQCKDSKAEYWGFKEEPLLTEEMKALYARMKECGKTTFLEVVAYTEEECLAGAKQAVECGCDILMGTLFFDSINELCKEHGLKYMPFVGQITGRPSVLEGTVEGMLAEAKEYIAKGAYGIDLLGYRYTGNATELNKAFVAGLDAPVCLAGSVDSFQRRHLRQLQLHGSPRPEQHGPGFPNLPLVRGQPAPRRAAQ